MIKQTSFNSNTPPPNGQLPIHLAVCEGEEKLVQTLLQAGANPGKEDHQQLTAYDHAVLLGQEQILKILFKNLKRIKKSYKVTETLSHIRSLHQKLLANHKQLNPLQRAILNGKKENVEFWLNKQVTPIQTVTSDNCSLLHLAAIGPNSDILPLLLQRECSVNTIDNFGCSPLHYAAANHNRKALYYLLETKDIDLNTEDKLNTNAISLLRKTAHEKDPLTLPKLQVISALAGMINIIAVHLLKNNLLHIKQSSEICTATALISEWVTNMATFGYTSQKNWTKRLLGIAASVGHSYISSISPQGNQSVSTFRSVKVAKNTLSNLAACWNNIRYRPLKSIRNIIVYGMNTLTSGVQLYNAFECNTHINLDDYFEKPIQLITEKRKERIKNERERIKDEIEIENLRKQWTKRYGNLEQTCQNKTVDIDDLHIKVQENIDNGKFFKVPGTWNQLLKCRSLILKRLEKICLDHLPKDYLNNFPEKLCYLKVRYEKQWTKKWTWHGLLQGFDHNWFHRDVEIGNKTEKKWQIGDVSSECFPVSLGKDAFHRLHNNHFHEKDCVRHALAAIGPRLDIKYQSPNNPQYAEYHERIRQNDKIDPDTCKTVKGRTWKQCHRVVLRLDNAYNLLEDRRKLNF